MSWKRQSWVHLVQISLGYYVVLIQLLSCKHKTVKIAAKDAVHVHPKTVFFCFRIEQCTSAIKKVHKCCASHGIKDILET